MNSCIQIKTERGLLPGKLFDHRRKRTGAAATVLVFSHGKFESDEMQLPAMFIADAEGKVETAIYAEDSTDLPTLDELFAML